MNLYRISDRWATAGDPPAFDTDWAGSFEQAKACITTILRDNAELSPNSFLVELVEYPTDKNALLDHLTGTPLTVLRRWISTPRRSLREVEQEQEAC